MKREESSMKRYISPKIESIALRSADVITFSTLSSSDGDSYNWADFAKQATSSTDIGDEFF